MMTAKMLEMLAGKVRYRVNDEELEALNHTKKTLFSDWTHAYQPKPKKRGK